MFYILLFPEDSKVLPITPIIDGLRFDKDGLDCFVVPIYIATQAFGLENPRLFNFYYYTYIHYRFLLSCSLSQGVSIEECTIDYVLNNKLGLNLKKIHIENSMVETIIDCIDQGFPVLVPTDKKEYPYWYKYREKSGAHLLLVKGYIPLKKLFITQDYEQNYWLLHENDQIRETLGDIYSTYPMSYENCISAFESFNDHFSLQNEVMYLCPNNERGIITFSEALVDISIELCSKQDRLKNLIELNVGSLFKHFNKKEENTEQILRVINSKQITYKLLNSYFSENQQDSKLKSLVSSSLQVFEKWKSSFIKARILSERTKINKNILDRDEKEIISLETEYLKCLISIL